MRKLFKSFILLIIFSFFAGCSLNVGTDSDCNSMKFNFRTSENLIGSVISVTLENDDSLIDIKQKEISGDISEVSFNFTDLTPGEKIKINVVILKGNQEIYKGSAEKLIQEGSNSIKITLIKQHIFGGHFLWTKNGGFQVTYDNLNSQQTESELFNAPISVDLPVSDFTFTPDGDIWLILGDGSEYVIYRNNQTEILQENQGMLEEATDGALINASGIISYDMGVLLTEAKRVDTGFESHIWYGMESNTPNKLNVIELPINGLDSPLGEITEIAVYDNTVYVVENYSKDRQRKFKIYKGIINTSISGVPQSITMEKNPVMDSFTVAESDGHTLLADYSFIASDIYGTADALYVLALDVTSGPEEYGVRNNYSRGAIIKINNSNGEVKIKGLHEENPDSVNPSSKYNIYMMSKDSFVSNTKYFLGPRKFIALKPKELVIADSGAYIDETKNMTLAKKIFKVNLEDFTLSCKDSPELLREDLFGGTMGSGYSVN